MRFDSLSDLSLSLVVPLFNEEQRLAASGAALVEFAAACGPGSELLLVDDGSTDDTCAVAEEVLDARPPQLFAHLVRRRHEGKGAAVGAGLSLARASVAAFCDVDLATPLDELARLAVAASTAPVLVIGSRDVVSTRLVRHESSTREALGKTYNRLLRLSLTPGVYDTQCGAKVAASAVWRELLPWCRQTGFAWDAELVAVARRRGIAVWEVGVAWSHDGRSRVRPLRDGAAMVRAVPRIWADLQRVPSLLEGRATRPFAPNFLADARRGAS